MTKIYVVRHAEAEGNLYRRIHGQYDSLLTEMGMRQLEALRKRLGHPIRRGLLKRLYRARKPPLPFYERNPCP